VSASGHEFIAVIQLKVLPGSADADLLAAKVMRMSRVPVVGEEIDCGGGRFSAVTRVRWSTRVMVILEDGPATDTMISELEQYEWRVLARSDPDEWLASLG